MSKETYTAAEFRKMKPKPKSKVAPQKKTQSAKEMMDISVSELGHLIDQTLLKVPQYVEYGSPTQDNVINCRVDGLEIEIVFKHKKP